MTRPQHALEIQQEGLAEQARDWFGSNSPAFMRKILGGETSGRSHHAVNIRLSKPLLFTDRYVTIVAGTERRSRERAAEAPACRCAHFFKEAGLMVVPQ